MAEPGRPRGYRLLHTNSVEVLLRLSRHLRPALIPRIELLKLVP